jgi:hypothetical protein
MRVTLEELLHERNGTFVLEHGPMVLALHFPGRVLQPLEDIHGWTGFTVW